MPTTATDVSLNEAIAQIDLLLAADGRADDGNAPAAAVTGFGSYDGLPPRIALLPDGRGATLLEPIAYHGGDGGDWPVPAGAALDGASIPRAFWTLIGGPFEGRYRDASIVHDHYCVSRERRWADTHRMFHDAMRCSGVGRAQAGVMFYAVYRFGPRWPDPAPAGLAGTMAEARPEAVDPATMMRDARAIVDGRLDPDAIAALVDHRDARNPGR